MANDNKPKPTAAPPAKPSEAGATLTPEAELAAIEAEISQVEVASRLIDAKARLAELRKKVPPVEPSFVNARGQRIPERYRGTKTYRLGQPHYREGVYHDAGGTITVTDEVPSRTWKPVEKRQVLVDADVVEAEPAKRSADLAI